MRLLHRILQRASSRSFEVFVGLLEVVPGCDRLGVLDPRADDMHRDEFRQIRGQFLQDKFEGRHVRTPFRSAIQASRSEWS